MNQIKFFILLFGLLVISKLSFGQRTEEYAFIIFQTAPKANVTTVKIGDNPDVRTEHERPKGDPYYSNFGLSAEMGKLNEMGFKLSTSTCVYQGPGYLIYNYVFVRKLE